MSSPLVGYLLLTLGIWFMTESDDWRIRTVGTTLIFFFCLWIKKT